MGRLSVRTRVLLMIAMWIPVAAMFALARNSALPVAQQITIMVALLGVSAALALGAAVAVWRERREARGSEGAAVPSAPRPAVATPFEPPTAAVGARLLLLAVVWTPLVALFFFASSERSFGHTWAVLSAAVLLIVVAAALSVVIVRPLAGGGSGADSVVGTPPSAPVGSEASFQFTYISRGSAVVGFSAVTLVAVGQNVLRDHGQPDLLFVGAIALLFAATFGFVVWKGRIYVDVYADRIRAQTLFGRKTEDDSADEGLPISSITRLEVSRSWGMHGFALSVEVLAEDSAQSGGLSIPLGVEDRAEGERCLARVLGLVPPEVVDSAVVRLKTALDVLEAAGSGPGEAAVAASRALTLTSRGKLEDAAQLLSAAPENADLHRAGTELAEVARGLAA